jgi:uncharacterized repeat protein (TIGR03803 family)
MVPMVVFPMAALLRQGRKAIWHDTRGGSNGRGVIFSFDPSSSTYTKLKAFDGTNGANPVGSLMQARNGKLYGMTQ